MSDALTVWRQACHVVLDQSGRARLHDTRAALNNIALGLEVLRHELSAAASTTASRVFDIMRRDLAAAADELSGLHALLTSVASDDVIRLSTCLEWADLVARPVARRCGINLVLPSASAVPVRDVDRRLAVAVAQVLVEAALEGPRGGRCDLHMVPDGDAFVIEWQVAGGTSSDAHPGGTLAEMVPGSRAHLETVGDRRALTVELSTAA